MNKEFERFLNTVMKKLLEGNDEIFKYLQKQYEYTSIDKIEETGVGFYITYKLSKKYNFPLLDKTFRIGDLNCDISTLNYGAGFLLYVENGVMSLLEIYTYGEETWPIELKNYNFYYTDDNRKISY